MSIQRPDLSSQARTGAVDAEARPGSGLPAHLRPRLFAGAELTLELFRIYSAALDLDIESIWILLCVTQESMGSFVLDPERAKIWNGAEIVSDAVRAPLSRRAVAERTGLPRETVRRKMATLTERGLLMVDDFDRVRVQSSGWTAEALEAFAEKIQSAVDRHQDRIDAIESTVQ